MVEYTDFNKLRQERDFRAWYNTMATEEEKELVDIAKELSTEYFRDFRFEPHTIVDDFTVAHIEEDDGELSPYYTDAPELLTYFDYQVLEAYKYKVEPLEEGVAGLVNLEEHIFTIPPEHLNREEGKPHILHELIHIYEEALDNVFSFFRDILFVCLYKELSNKIPDLYDRMIAHTHLLHGENITLWGGQHDGLFFLKSLELDLQCGYKLGTVCGYGRDDFEAE